MVLLRVNCQNILTVLSPRTQWKYKLSYTFDHEESHINLIPLQKKITFTIHILYCYIALIYLNLKSSIDQTFLKFYILDIKIVLNDNEF